MIPYGRQSIDAADIEAVAEVLRSDFLTQGPAVPKFEQTVAAYCGAAHGVAVSNGTAALHVACMALDMGPGDILWTSPITFVASANCALYCGATVDFVDIEHRDPVGDRHVEPARIGADHRLAGLRAELDRRPGLDRLALAQQLQVDGL